MGDRESEVEIQAAIKKSQWLTTVGGEVEPTLRLDGWQNTSENV